MFISDSISVNSFFIFYLPFSLFAFRFLITIKQFLFIFFSLSISLLGLPHIFLSVATSLLMSYIFHSFSLPFSYSLFSLLFFLFTDYQISCLRCYTSSLLLLSTPPNLQCISRFPDLTTLYSPKISFSYHPL